MSFMQDAVREWAWIVGADRPDDQWLLSDYDTWERNPHYSGPDQGHPEYPVEQEEWLPENDWYPEFRDEEEYVRENDFDDDIPF